MFLSELLRLRSSRTAIVVAIVVYLEAVVGGLGAAILPSIVDWLIRLNDVIPNATSANELPAGALDALSLRHLNVQATVADLAGGFGLGISVAVLGAISLGALSIAAEYRRGSIVLGLLTQPRRIILLAHKAGALVVTVALASVPLLAIKAAALFFGSLSQNVTVQLNAVDLAGLWLRGLVVLALYALLGMGLGLLVRAPVAVLAVIFGLITVEASLRPLSALITHEPSFVNFMPFGLAMDAVRGPSLLSELSVQVSLGIPLALTALILWTVVLVGIGTARFKKSDLPVLS